MKRLDVCRKAGLLALAAACLPACSAESGTGGEAIRFEMRMTSAPQEGERVGTFTTNTGFRVTLSEAYVALGPIYLYENSPPVAAAVPHRSLLGRAWDLLVPSVHAHPGDQHFAGGTVKGEFIGQIAFDALSAEPLSLGAVDGIAGVARSFSVELNPPIAAGAVALLGTHQAYVVGTAEKDGASYEFEGGLAIENMGTLRKVEGIPMAADLREGSRLTVELYLSSWLIDADFSRLDESANDGRLLITPASQVRTAWFIGARSFSAFSAFAE
jgi:hypothetical protein